MTIDQDAETLRAAIPVGAATSRAALDRILARIAELEAQLEVAGWNLPRQQDLDRITELETATRRFFEDPTQATYNALEDVLEAEWGL